MPGPLSPLLHRKVRNFGDLLGPIIVHRILENRSLTNPPTEQRLLTVGSILHMARTGDVVWGSGRNGKIGEEHHRFEDLDVRSVRGPLTAQWLDSRGIKAPRTFGDPAILIPQLFPELAAPELAAPELAAAKRESSGPITFVPNLTDVDFGTLPDGVDHLDPRENPYTIMRRLARSRFVIASSLHAIIIAEAFGVEARLVRTVNEHEFKYADHYLGTGRADFRMADTVAQALRLGGEPPMQLDPAPLLAVFPDDLFVRGDMRRGFRRRSFPSPVH
jgi:pyruvyltransferase